MQTVSVNDGWPIVDPSTLSSDVQSIDVPPAAVSAPPEVVISTTTSHATVPVSGAAVPTTATASAAAAISSAATAAAQRSRHTDQMVTEDDASAIRHVGSRGLLYRTLKYVLMSNRASLYELSGEMRLPQVTCHSQFAVLQLNPEREQAFQQRKAQCGSFFAFHGAARDCWYSIMRNSLRNLSGSTLQRNGAALGSGIYLAERANYSLNYSQRAPILQRGVRSDKDLTIQDLDTLALVECIDVKSYVRGHMNAHMNAIGGKGALGSALATPVGDRIFVVPDDADIAVRFVFAGVKKDSVKLECASSVRGLMRSSSGSDSDPGPGLRSRWPRLVIRARAA